jgi:hypothetical protein
MSPARPVLDGASVGGGSGVSALLGPQEVRKRRNGSSAAERFLAGSRGYAVESPTGRVGVVAAIVPGFPPESRRS